ncbi:MAG: ABC transporter ATP-binding protein [Ignavibacteriaceae bacterium]
MEYFIKLFSVTKQYEKAPGFNLEVLHNISLNLIPDEQQSNVYSILAPFGAGKSSLLKIIAGLESISSGEMITGGTSGYKPDGKIIYLPEKPSSFPWLNVNENLKMPEHYSYKKNLVLRKIDEVIELTGLNGYENHFPHPDSKGFRLRISIAQALRFFPKLIILDDSLKALDSITRKEIYRLLLDLKENKIVSFIIGTTNLLEAVQISDSIFLMKKNPGEIIDNIIIDRAKIDSADFKLNDYVNSVRQKIESVFYKFGEISTINLS